MPKQKLINVPRYNYWIGIPYLQKEIRKDIEKINKKLDNPSNLEKKDLDNLEGRLTCLLRINKLLLKHMKVK